MSDLINRQAAIDKVSGLIEEQRFYDIIGKLESLPSAQPDDHRYEQGIIEGRVQMRTEILKGIKNLVGDETWQMI